MNESEQHEHQLNSLAKHFVERGNSAHGMWQRMCNKNGQVWEQDMKRRIKEQQLRGNGNG